MIIDVLKVNCHQQNEDIVNVDEHIRNVPKDEVHEPLKILTCVLQSKRCPVKHVKTEGSDHSGLLAILLRHRDLMVTLEEVHL